MLSARGFDAIDLGMTAHARIFAALLTDYSNAQTYGDPDLALDAMLEVYDEFGGWDKSDYHSLFKLSLSRSINKFIEDLIVRPELMKKALA